MNKELAFYEEGSLSIVDTLNNETGMGTCFGETVEQVRKRYPKAEIVPFDFALERINEATKEVYPMLNPIEITEEQYWDALECLPPMQWKKTEEGESFKMSELTFMDITACYVKKNGKYYSMNGRVKTKHEELLAVC